MKVRASIDEYLSEASPLLNYLSRLEGDSVGQRMHRAHYIAEVNDQVFRRLRVLERACDVCEEARPLMTRYRLDLAERLLELTSERP